MGIRQVRDRITAKLALASIEEDITAAKRTLAATTPGSELETLGLAVVAGLESARDQVAKVLEPETPAKE